MQWFRLRPTFQISLQDSREDVIEKLRLAYPRSVPQDCYRLFGEYGELHLPRQEHRLWSPHLSFYVVSQPSGAVLHGRFAPRIDVWTVVWITYLLMIFTAFFGAALAVSQWQLREPLWGLWLALAALGVFVSLYLVAHIGQQWSVDQMHQLRAELDKTLQQAGVR